MGKEPVRRFVSTMERLSETKTLSQIAQSEYGHTEYWPLIAAVNLDRGYYQLRSATSGTSIAKDSYLEIWKVSEHYGEDSNTRVKISGPAVQAANEELLASNEELQSTNEELQSVNEELYSVNAEYQRKIADLTELANDLAAHMAIEQTIASPKGRDAAAGYIREFVEDVKASGLVARMLVQHGVRGVSVSPAAPAG